MTVANRVIGNILGGKPTKDRKSRNKQSSKNIYCTYCKDVTLHSLSENDNYTCDKCGSTAMTDVNRMYMD